MLAAAETSYTCEARVSVLRYVARQRGEAGDRAGATDTLSGAAALAERAVCWDADSQLEALTPLPREVAEAQITVAD